MEKVTYQEFPTFVEVSRENNLFFLHCGLCGLDFIPLESRPPHIAVEYKLKNMAQEHNRLNHWPDLKSLSTKP